MHLVDGEVSGIDEGLEEVEIVCPTGVDHGHGGKHEVELLLHFGFDLLRKCFESVAENVVPGHVRVINII